MDGISGAFAVVSLAIQLVTTVKEIHAFLSNVSNAPRELIRLTSLLNQLHHVLDHVKYLLEHQHESLGETGATFVIETALENCRVQVELLVKVVERVKDGFNGPGAHQCDPKWFFATALGSLRFVGRRDEIQKIERDLQTATMGLQMGMSANLTQLQIAHLQKTATISDQIALLGSKVLPLRSVRAESRRDENSEFTASTDVSRAQQSPTMVSEQTNRLYSGILGNVHSRTMSKTLKARPGSTVFRKSPTSEEQVVTIAPSFMDVAIELRFMHRLGEISRSIRTYPIISHQDDSIFLACDIGDIGALQTAFGSGKVSPFATDRYGYGLLHRAASAMQTELCSFLLQIGLDADYSASSGQKAAQRVALLGAKSRHGSKLKDFTDVIVDTIRVVSQAQDDFTASDLSTFFKYYHGPPEGAEYILNQESVRWEIRNREEGEYPVLAGALRTFVGSPEWEPLIRTLVRRGAYLHAPVPREGLDWYDKAFSPFPCEPPPYVTPLDELFMWTDSPFEAKAIGDKWLDILLTEGIDVRRYLERELELHPEHPRLTIPSESLTTVKPGRILIIKLDDPPAVYWEWWISATESASLLVIELEGLALSNHWHEARTWEESWPYRYPKWHDIRLQYEYERKGSTWKLNDEGARLRKLSGQRYDRRWDRKKSKAERQQGIIKSMFRMPGAWMT